MRAYHWDLLDWMDETSRAFNELSKDATSSYAQHFPPMNTYLDEENGTLTVEFALAGYAPEDIDLLFTGEMFKLKGKKQETDKRLKVLKKGIRAADFEVQYRLPNGKFDIESAEAVFKDGLLTLTLQPSSALAPRKIPLLTG